MRRVVAGRPGGTPCRVGWSYNPAPAQIAMAVGSLPAAGRPRRGTSPAPYISPRPAPDNPAIEGGMTSGIVL